MQVKTLFELRDYWEWLAPGYTDPKTKGAALAGAAFTSFQNLRHYRDFLVQREAGSTKEAPRVGLWAKEYMTSPSYEYVGTLLTRQSVDAKTRRRPPAKQARDASDAKVSREAAVAKKLRSVSGGVFQRQFPAARLEDAIAMCEHRWGHFAQTNSEALVPDAWLRLPSELGALVARARGESQGLTAVERRSQAMEAIGILGVGAPRVLLKRRAHVAADIYGFTLGRGVDATLAVGVAAASVAEFPLRPVACGGFVIARPAGHSHWSRAAPVLAHFPFWLWRVLRVYAQGDPLPGDGKPARGHTYEAQLYRPRGASGRAKWSPCWTDGRPQFIRTPAEKTRHGVHVLRRRKAGRQSAKSQPSPLFSPMRAFLRPDNVVGGGFHLTPGGSVPSHVQDYRRSVQGA